MKNKILKIHGFTVVSTLGEDIEQLSISLDTYQEAINFKKSNKKQYPNSYIISRITEEEETEEESGITVFSGESAERFMKIMRGEIKSDITPEKLREILRLGQEMSEKLIIRDNKKFEKYVVNEAKNRIKEVFDI